MTKYKAVKRGDVKYDYHRLLMEQILGRKLDFDEVVHHINGNSLDNDPSNLMVMTRAEHTRLHQTGCKRSIESRMKQSESTKGKPKRTLRKLTDSQVDYIRTHYIPRDSEFGARALSRRFGISHSHILEIINNNAYVYPCDP